jgi:predicted hotdog family 3-hydroxylacyl-ACP dehydratase
VTDVTAYPPIEELLPHRGSLLLIDRIRHAEDGRKCVAEYEVRPDSWYADANGAMPAWIGIELMAQTIAACFGVEQRNRGGPAKVGLLLGSRRYVSSVPFFERGAVLEITADVQYREANGFGAFDCTIEWRGRRLAEATIKIYESESFERLMQQAPA